MENIVTVLGIVGKDGRITLSINDKTYKLDEQGKADIDVNELVISGEKGVFEYDRLLGNMIGDSQRMELYELFVGSNRFGLTDVMSMLAIEKGLARDILILGFKNRVLKRVDTQWKLEVDKKEAIKQVIRSYKKVTEPEETPEPYKFNQTTQTEGQMGIGPVLVVEKKVVVMENRKRSAK